MREPPSRLIFLRLSSLLIALTSFFHLNSQTILTILDEKGMTLVGVEVFNHDYTFAEVSDTSGLVIVPSNVNSDTLTLKYLGYEPQILELGNIDLKEIDIQLNPSNQILEEVILVGRSDIRSRDFLQKIDAVDSKDIALSNPQTSVDALARNADVYVQKSQMGGGSPVVRGFEANKVLLVVDGVRMNNAIYRNGHLQNAITVDNSVLDQMEVIYGPSSLMYGSDALGGVIHFRTKDPVLNLSGKKKARIFGNYYARYSSASSEKTIHGDVNLGFRDWASLTSVTISDFGDLRMGARRTEEFPNHNKRLQYQVREAGEDRLVENPSPNRQVGTAYNQFDVLQKVRYQLNRKMNLTANIQLSTSSNIPRYDQLVLPASDGLEFAEWYYGPQDRFLASAKYKWMDESPWMDEMVAIISHQEIEESRISRTFGSDIRSIGVENVGVTALTVDVKKSLNRMNNHTFYYGADYNNNQVRSVARNDNIKDGTSDQNLFTRYPSGGSRMNIMGVYTQYVNESPDSSLVLHGGLRFTSYETTVKYLGSDPIQWPAFFYEGVSARNSSFSYSAGVNWQPSDKWTIRILTATAFRAPNVDDIGKLRVKNNNAVVPNTGLEAEKSWNGEVNMSRKLGAGRLLSASIFYTRLSDAIVRQDFMLPDGSTTFSDGSRTYNVEANVNADQAEIAGLSASLQLRFSELVDFNTSLNYIRGRAINGEEITPLSHIPPLYGRTKLSYHKESWKLTFLSQYNGRKPLDQYGGSTDNPEYATSDGALAWAIFNVYADYTLGDYTLQLGVENLLDKHYTPFASGVSGAGLNVVVAVRGRF